MNEQYKDTKNGICLPDAYNLRKISAEFQVSSDYILGLTDELEIKYLAQDITLMFEKYKQLRFNPILEDEDYYWIKLEVSEEKTYIESTYTQWEGFAEDGTEIRVPRNVEPEAVLELCDKRGDFIVIINKISEISLYCLFGGNAIIKESLYKEHLSNIFKPKES